MDRLIAEKKICGCGPSEYLSKEGGAAKVAAQGLPYLVTNPAEAPPAATVDKLAILREAMKRDKMTPHERDATPLKVEEYTR